jgi:hypothetical protein
MDLQYSIIWSNEDGGTNTPQLMARWGRSTDIEWIYRVEVDQNANRVPGVMAAEVKREGKIEATPDPATPEVSDQRDYLYLAVKKDTVPPGNSVPSWVGVSVGVKLNVGTTIYRLA